MNKTSNFVFITMQVISWMIFVGFCIEAGAMIVNFIYSLFKPIMVGNLYEKLDLSLMYARSKWTYYSMYSFAIVIAVMKAYLFYIVIMLQMKLDLNKPFSSFAAAKVKAISYYTISIGILSLIARQTSQNLLNHGYEIDRLSQFWVDSQAYILMGAVLYIIAIIFHKGVELQSENELTV